MKGVIGIDVGGTKIAFGAVSRAGKILKRRTIATHPDDSFEQGIERLSAGIVALLADIGWGTDEIGGIGIGCPGPVDTENGVILSVYTLPGWSNRAFAQPMSARFATPVRLENDANAALLGEALAGAAKGKKSAVMLTLGTGVGGAVLLDGKIHHGAGGAHPELGHVPALMEGPKCPCGIRGCYEVIAAGPAIAEAGQAIGLGGSEAVFAAAAEGHAGAEEIIARVAKATEAAVWTILHTFLPEIILFGGGIADAHWPLFEAAAQKSLATATLAPDEGITIARAKLGNDAGIVGAASLVM